MRRGSHLAATLLLSFTLGLHWAVLQSVAWTSMLVERTLDQSLEIAVSTTFDGQHPCRLCKVVEAGRSCESTPFETLKLSPLDLSTPQDVETVLFPPRLGSPSLPWVKMAASRHDRPPIPPPRAA